MTQPIGSMAAEIIQSAASPWQPIETAPKDGRKIDLMFPAPRGRTIDCFWSVSAVEPDGRWIWLSPKWGQGELLPEGEWFRNSYPNMEPTHWMWSPAPPGDA